RFTAASGCDSSFNARPAAWSRCKRKPILPDATMPEAPHPPPWHNSPMPTVAEFKIEYKRIPARKGALAAEPPAFATDYEDVRVMYRAMTRERLFDAKAVNLQ